MELYFAKLGSGVKIYGFKPQIEALRDYIGAETFNQAFDSFPAGWPYLDHLASPWHGFHPCGARGTGCFGF
jgi:hypothetical protein